MKTKLRKTIALISAATIAIFLSLFAQENLRRDQSNNGPARPQNLTPADLRAKLEGFSVTGLPSRQNPPQNISKLGEFLFFDEGASADGRISCAHCHKPEFYFSDGLKVSVGISSVHRNAPGLVNTSSNFWFFWDGRADSLAAQALQPIEHPNEHGTSRIQVVRLILEKYQDAYRSVFGKLPAHLPYKKISIPNFQALPRPQTERISIGQAAYAVSTLPLLKLSDLLKIATIKKMAPAKVFLEQNGSSEAPAHDPRWYQNWETLSIQQQESINQVFANFGLAIAAFEESLWALDSPFDLFCTSYITGTNNDMSAHFNERFGAQEFRGFEIFSTKGQCDLCHSGPTFSNSQFHNTGVPQERIDLGRALGVVQIQTNPFNCQGGILPKSDSESCRELNFLDHENIELMGAFKTPTLRNLKHTAPYMHDGSMQNLEEVIDFYDQLSNQPSPGHREESLKPLNLSDEEKADLKAFLHSLNGSLGYQLQ